MSIRHLFTALLAAVGTSSLELLPPLPKSDSDFTTAATWDWAKTAKTIFIDSSFANVSDTDGLTLIPPTAFDFASTFRDDISILLSQNWTLERVNGFPNFSNASGIFLGKYNGTANYENGSPTTEGYELRVTSPSSVFIGGSGARGMFWGTRTLLQLIMTNSPTGGIGSLSVGFRTTDAPAYATRGFLLDAGRKWYSPSFLKELCSYASFFKMSEFHYHLSDNYPLNRGKNESWQDVYSHFSLLPEKDTELKAILHGRENETLSRSDFMDLQQHCVSRGVTVIPEIEAPGHCLYLTKWKPELALPKRDLLNLTHPDTIPTVKRIWAEFLPWFQTKEVHIGADEYERDLADDYVNFVNDMSRWVNKTSNKRVRIWGTDEPSDKLTIDRDIVVQHWQYGQSDPIQVLQDGHDLINSQDWWAYTSIKSDHAPILPARYPQFFNESRLLNFADQDGWQWQPSDFNPFNKTMQVDPGAKRLRGATLAAWNDNGPDASTQLEAYYSLRRGIALTGARAWSGKRGVELNPDLVSTSVDFFSPFIPAQNLDRTVRGTNLTSVPTGSSSANRNPIISWKAGEEWVAEGSKGMNYTLTLTADGPFSLSGPDNSLSLVQSEDGHSLVFDADGYKYPLRSVSNKDGTELDPGHPGRIWVNASSTHEVVENISTPVNITITTDVLHGSLVWINGQFMGRFEVFVYGGRNTQFSWNQMAFVAPLRKMDGGLTSLVLDDGVSIPGAGAGNETAQPPSQNAGSTRGGPESWTVIVAALLIHVTASAFINHLGLKIQENKCIHKSQVTMAAEKSSQLPTFAPSDYVKFFSAGALAATLTHGAATPIDVVKTRIQVDDAMKGLNMVKAARTIAAKEGASALLTGFGPTAVGYLVQGGSKFAGYEFFKKKFVEMAGGPERAVQHRTGIYLGASATAEFFADILLCPLEATRIRLVSQRGYATGLTTGFARMAREEGPRGFYSGFVPLLFKQVPYAVGQFAVHEAAVEGIYRTIGPEKKATLTHAQATGVELASGIVAGVAAAVLSHPADTLLSAINKGAGDKGQGATARMFQLAGEFGPKRLLLTGLGPRIFMTCGLVAGQFVIYAQCKALVGAAPGVEIHKED
ncbi:hypothetical protein MCOR14_005634 [Pyricularia oryzae]|nr:hypothetical protein MCOR17_004399 [Pyricularia oryzae]KAI6508848.1 hypothetical protein MCOR13_002005 [Pyricularia oryzae]KAI6608152.1 hypothetical protein MCOR04_000418 [Pyricularia oryzae]KAI6635707.1 hypothetical protein MCOR14_005634 [Pyricularia oryzae]